MDQINYYKKNTIVVVLALMTVFGVCLYFENYTFVGNASSIISLIILLFSYNSWKRVFSSRLDKRKIIIFSLFSFIFGLSIVFGKRLETDTKPSFPYIMAIGITLLILPILYSIQIGKNESPVLFKNRNYKLILFSLVVIEWLMIYLASFPGVYANDAMYWYYEFNNPNVPISSQWSVLYTGLFYFFVHIGYVLFHSYEVGCAVFILLQMASLLSIIWYVYSFLEKRINQLGLFMLTLFFLMPNHGAFVVSTAQGVPFTGCFMMIICHLIRMIEEPDIWHNNSKQKIGYVFWGVLATLLRNNAYFIFIVFIPFCLLFLRSKTRICLTILNVVIIIIASIYKGPVLDAFGVAKGTDIREMISMPLQQLAYVYNYEPDKFTDEERETLLQYISDGDLQIYKLLPSISDHLKSNTNLERLRNNPVEFMKLYISVGLKSSRSYIKAAYLQNLGLFYLDKDYPDPRMYHAYLTYSSYDFQYDYIKNISDEFIEIKRYPVLAGPDECLKVLFEDSGDGYGADDQQLFSAIPLISVFGRASTYFWLLIYLCFYGIYQKSKESLFICSFYLCYTLSVVLAPVILYRYYAPVNMAIPILFVFVMMNNNARLSEKQEMSYQE